MTKLEIILTKTRAFLKENKVIDFIKENRHIILQLLLFAIVLYVVFFLITYWNDIKTGFGDGWNE